MLSKAGVAGAVGTLRETTTINAGQSECVPPLPRPKLPCCPTPCRRSQHQPPRSMMTDSSVYVSAAVSPSHADKAEALKAALMEAVRRLCGAQHTFLSLPRLASRYCS